MKFRTCDIFYGTFPSFTRAILHQSCSSTTARAMAMWGAEISFRKCSHWSEHPPEPIFWCNFYYSSIIPHYPQIFHWIIHKMNKKMIFPLVIMMQMWNQKSCEPISVSYIYICLSSVSLCQLRSAYIHVFVQVIQLYVYEYNCYLEYVANYTSLVFHERIKFMMYSYHYPTVCIHH